MKTKSIFNYLRRFCVFFIACLSFQMIAQNQQIQPQDFIILKNKDTIYGEKIRNTKWFNKLGRITVVKKNGKELVYGYNEVYQLHVFNRKGKESVYELVKESTHDENSYQTMDVIINKGSVKLYYHDPGQWADRPFVVSNFFHGYARKRNLKRLLKELDKCEAFREKFTQKKERREKHIKKLIEFYNGNCE